jgi:PEP-CTERM motif-containing protein
MGAHSKTSRLGLATVAMAGFLGVCGIGSPAFASLCTSSTNCTLLLTQGNAGSGFGTGSFGTVTLTLNSSTDVVTVDVSLASGFLIINTGFPGSFGFVDNLGGGLTIGNFSSSAYSGATSDATNDLHFDGFGFANDAAATTGPSAGDASAVSEVTFTVSDGTKLTDVNDIVNLFAPAGGDGPAVFVVDAINTNKTGPGAGLTGLISADSATGGGGGGQTTVPEPSPLALMGIGLVGLALFRLRKRLPVT